MARTKKQEDDAIARLTDASEDALRQLVDFPHRLVVRSRDDLRQQINHIATRVRAIDPLVARVAKLEKRVSALERKTPARRKASARRTPRAPRREIAATAPHEQGPATIPPQEIGRAHV